MALVHCVSENREILHRRLYTQISPLFQQREGGRPMAMEEVTEVAEVGILVVGMTRSVVREVGGAQCWQQLK